MQSPSTLRDKLSAQLRFALNDSAFVGLERVGRGKVRDVYRQGGQLVVVTTDRISAFDRVWGTVPCKGQILNLCAAWWFERVAHLVPHHFVDITDPYVARCVPCEPLPVEFVVRGFLTGTTSTSIAAHYAKGARRYCGHVLPDGLRLHEMLPTALLTPTTKATVGGHDNPLSRDEIVSRGLLDAQTFDQASEYAHALFAYGQRLCERRGLILVDTKYEFGRDAQGQLRLIDEVHTPDSSRFWRRASYRARVEAGEDPEALDKDTLRRWLNRQGWSVAESAAAAAAATELPDALRVDLAERYIEAYRCITGEEPALIFGDACPRLSECLK